MAAKGAILKGEVAEKIIAAFPGSFLYNDGKEIRINWTENGEPLQIKVTLTCAKVAVESDRLEFNDSPAVAATTSNTTTTEKIPQEPSQEEKERLATLLQNLGL